MRATRWTKRLDPRTHLLGGQRARLGALAVLALASSLPGCRPSNRLTRDVAAEKIAEASPLKEVVKAEVLRNAGTRCAWHRERPTEAPMPVWQTLESAGLIRLVDTLPPVDPTFTQRVCVPMLTAKGEQVAREQAWQETSRPGFLGVRDHYWVVPMAQRQIAEVTGVTEPPEGSTKAEAHFT